MQAFYVKTIHSDQYAVKIHTLNVFGHYYTSIMMSKNKTHISVHISVI